jgi:deoxyribodipyrimidine photo-lyase
MAGVARDTGRRADARFYAWASGHTGYPLVDAGMRQLAATGWLPNRVRLVTASFLTKDLHLDWQRGARLFLDRLVDADLASNNLSWQWVAGTGIDPAPYYRILNPVTQAQRFDPDGSYVRRWVPELRGIDGAAVHEPWLVTDGDRSHYPDRVVDHDVERRDALSRYENRAAAVGQ